MQLNRLTITYSDLTKEATGYESWAKIQPIPKMPAAVAKEGAGSESRTPLMHYGTVLPVYLGIIRYLTQAKPKKGQKLLELGSGSGRLLAYLKVMFPQLDVYGVDYSPACVDYAQKHYGPLGVTFTSMQPGKTPYKSGTFDYVISSHVIEHIPAAEGGQFLQEVKRLLKEGGFAFIGTPERRRCQNLFHENPTDDPKLRLVPPHEHEYTLEELHALAETVFSAKAVRVDKLNNPVFHKIFVQSIANIRPKGTVRTKLIHPAYRAAAQLLPRPLFDTMTRTGAAITMKRNHLTYTDILKSHKIEKSSAKRLPDNLLLLCQK